MRQAFLSPALAVKLNEANSLGIALNVAYQRFEAKGIGIFAGFSEAPEDVSNRAHDDSTGVGVRLGWLGQLGDYVTLGATWQSKTHMGRFNLEFHDRRRGHRIHRSPRSTPVELLTALLAGVLFGWGLILSRMFDPQRVLAFLDVAGRWNPALAFTMGGAIFVAAPAFLYVRRRHADLLGKATELPDRFKFTGRLVAGSAIFGLGWGLSGICPGPGLLLLTGGSVQSIVFVGAVITGFFVEGLMPGGKALESARVPGR